ncbi:MAG: glutathione S-transferase family protein [Pseudomonadota bacterium]|nr:glutathione S-transferase family protein [Pseudomonadota bacterium]
MVKLANEDIKTREILDWKGLHVFHFPFSSCSQKLRIFIALKGVEWESHLIDLMGNENLQEYFLGVNPRGLLPVLVHDGDVHIESNDILTYLETGCPEPCLIPEGSGYEVAELLKQEDDLHLDLRALSFRFVFNPPHAPKSKGDLEVYANTGSGTVQGVKDGRVDVEIDFWEAIAEHGITDEVAQAAAAKFRQAFDDLDARLDGQEYVLGDTLSVIDIAWFIYANRLTLAGYPIAKLHPNMGAWYARLKEIPAIKKEITLPPPVKEKFDATRAQHLAEGVNLEAVAGL